MLKKNIYLVITLLVVGLSFVQAQSGDTIINGNNFTEKFDWLNTFAQSDSNYIVEVNADVIIDSLSLSFDAKRGIYITLVGVGATRTIVSGGFVVGSGVTLVLDTNITLRGKVDVNRGGSLRMNNGSTINGEINGGGVTVYEGTFTMNGGTITGETSRGGVNLYGGTFTMNGGAITGNNVTSPSATTVLSGGVYVNSGTFTMRGGNISENTTPGSGGGGVSVGSNGTFIMSGGTIYGNTTGNTGGGVFVTHGTFIMSGGTISGNTTTGNGGGGVAMSSGTFTMTGGNISGNTTPFDGGGVKVHGGTFTMSGGTISINTVAQGAGGVYVGSSGTFIMSGGTISSNIVTSQFTGSGGGVEVRGTFTMENGSITNNTANEGGGVYVHGNTYSKGIFTMNDGIISGNTAVGNRSSYGGGGVYVEGGTFIMNNGIISRNTVTGGKCVGGGVYVGEVRTIVVPSGATPPTWGLRMGTFIKNGGTVYGYNESDTVNSNVVKNDSGVVQNYRGHAVCIGDYNSTFLKIRESTVGPGDNISYISGDPPTASGVWNNWK